MKGYGTLMKRKIQKTVLYLVFLEGGIGLISGSTALADSLPTYKLDNVIITASRIEDRIVDTPADVYIITDREIGERHYQSVGEALDNVPGVTVKQSGFAGSDQHVLINGDDRVVVLIDGRRLNLDKGTYGRSGLDMSLIPSPEFIEKIEILKGAGSSLYGSDAAAGVINIITKSGSGKTKVTVDMNTGSWGTHNYYTSVSGKEKKTGYFLTLKKSSQDYVYYKNAKTNQNKKWPNSSNDTQSAIFKLDQQIGSDQLLTLYFSHLFKDGKKPYQAPESGPYYFKPNSWGTDLNNDISLKYTWNKSKKNAGFVQIYKNYYAGNFMDEGTHTEYGEKKEGIDLQQNFALGRKHEFISGLEWRQSTVDSPASYNDSKGKINTKAIYLQDIWTIDQSWSFTLGARYDKHNYFGDKTTLHAAVNKKFNKDNRAYFSWGQVFNAPQANDLFYYMPGGYGYGVYMGNPNLKPEEGNVYTLGYDSQVDKKTSAGMSLFYSDIKNAINWAAVDANNPFGDWTVSNVDKLKKRGLSVYLNHQFNNNWSTDFNYTYIKSEKSESGSEYNRDFNIPPNQYKFGIKYNKNKWDAELYGRAANGASDRKYSDASWLTLDFATRYKVDKNINIYAKIYNLTNVAYAENGGTSNGNYNYPMPGRSFLIGMQYSF